MDRWIDGWIDKQTHILAKNKRKRKRKRKKKRIMRCV